MRHTLTATITALTLATLAAAPMTGCQGSSLSSMMGQDAMALLSPLMKDAAKSYLTNINDLVSAVEKVSSVQDAVTIAPKIEPAAKDAGKAYKTLSSATPEERKLVWQAFGPDIDAANKRFLTQSSRVKGNALWGQALGSTFDQVKLFTSK